MKKIIAIAVILAGVVLLTIGNTIQMYSTISIIEKRLADKEHAVDTLTFEQEMAIVDSAIKAEEGIVYKSIYEVPNYEYYYEDRGYQTLVRYPNGMPKILVVIDYFEARLYEPEFKEGYRVRGYNYLFLSEDGRIIADTLYPIPGWRCVMPFDAKGKFTFNDPNLCRNLNK